MIEELKAYRIDEQYDEGNYRTIFTRDRDRIFFSKDFLRLGGKTQVFVEGYDDHMRNRLSHTLEVTQLAIKIATHFGLSHDLTNAIAYGHDIGHTPFGHAGERILNKIMNGCYQINNIKFHPMKGNMGFKHNWHGIRVLRILNKRFDGVVGFDISGFTEWGILNHTKLKYKDCKRKISADSRCR